MPGAIDPGERPGTDLIENLGTAVEKPLLVAADQPLELVAREQFVAQECRPERLDRHVAAAEFGPHLVQVASPKELQLLGAAGEFLGRGGFHAGGLRRGDRRNSRIPHFSPRPRECKGFG